MLRYYQILGCIEDTLKYNVLKCKYGSPLNIFIKKDLSCTGRDKKLTDQTEVIKRDEEGDKY